ncbi:MAG: hypothetical protein WCW84_07885 [Sulfurimonas sp.]|jgi:hypothetical protein
MKQFIEMGDLITLRGSKKHYFVVGFMEPKSIFSDDVLLFDADNYVGGFHSSKTKIIDSIEPFGVLKNRYEFDWQVQSFFSVRFPQLFAEHLPRCSEMIQEEELARLIKTRVLKGVQDV